MKNYQKIIAVALLTLVAAGSVFAADTAPAKGKQHKGRKHHWLHSHGAKKEDTKKS